MFIHLMQENVYSCPMFIFTEHPVQLFVFCKTVPSNTPTQLSLIDRILKLIQNCCCCFQLFFNKPISTEITLGKATSLKSIPKKLWGLQMQNCWQAKCPMKVSKST